MTRSLSGFISEARFVASVIAEAFVLGYSDTKQWATRTWHILRGTAELREEPCQLKDCDTMAVGEFPREKRWQDDLDVCRRHWIFLHVTVRVALAAIVATVISGMLAIVVVLG